MSDTRRFSARGALGILSPSIRILNVPKFQGLGFCVYEFLELYPGVYGSIASLCTWYTYCTLLGSFDEVVRTKLVGLLKIANRSWSRLFL